MDIEIIQKINNLALDLMKQGLASNREDAVIQAEKIFQGSNTEEYSSMRERMNKTTEKKIITTEINPAEMDLSADKISEILQKNTQFLVKTIKGFNARIESLEKELMGMKNKIAYRSIPSAGEILTREAVKEDPMQQRSSSQEQQNYQSQTGRADNSKVPSNHPRSGNYGDGDVSIEKFFYMGSK